PVLGNVLVVGQDRSDPAVADEGDLLHRVQAVEVGGNGFYWVTCAAAPRAPAAGRATRERNGTRLQVSSADYGVTAVEPPSDSWAWDPRRWGAAHPARIGFALRVLTLAWSSFSQVFTR